MNKLFQVHMLNDLGVKTAEDIAAHFDGLLAHLSTVCPDGRELALVKTKLEEACFYAKKAMASDPRNQK